jgi:hypothetical protein
MKIFLDIGIKDSLANVVEQVFTTLGEFEITPSVQDADGFVVSEQDKVEKYLTETSKPVVQVLWWNQRASSAEQSDRFKICRGFENGKIVPGFGFVEAMAFLKEK